MEDQLETVAAQDRVAGMWCDILDCERVDPDVGFIEAGGSSIDAVRLAARIQSELGIRVDAVEVAMVERFADLAALVRDRLDDARTG